MPGTTGPVNTYPCPQCSHAPQLGCTRCGGMGFTFAPAPRVPQVANFKFDFNEDRVKELEALLREVRDEDTIVQLDYVREDRTCIFCYASTREGDPECAATCLKMRITRALKNV